MKKVLIACIFCPIAALSQQVEGGTDVSNNIRKNLMSLPAIAEPQAQLVETLPNGNRVFALPQDNMPCIVPAPTYQVAGNVLPALALPPTVRNMPVAGLRKTPLIPPAATANTPLPPVPVPLPDWREQIPKMNK